MQVYIRLVVITIYGIIANYIYFCQLYHFRLQKTERKKGIYFNKEWEYVPLNRKYIF